MRERHDRYLPAERMAVTTTVAICRCGHSMTSAGSSNGVTACLSSLGAPPLAWPSEAVNREGLQRSDQYVGIGGALLSAPHGPRQALAGDCLNRKQTQCSGVNGATDFFHQDPVP